MRWIVIYPVDSANHFTDELTGVIPEFPTKKTNITISWKIDWFHLAAADLNKVKIKLSHIQQMTANQQINSFHVKLQLRRAFTHEPKRRKKQEMIQLVMRQFATDVNSYSHDWTDTCMQRKLTRKKCATTQTPRISLHLVLVSVKGSVCKKSRNLSCYLLGHVSCCPHDSVAPWVLETS